MVYWHELFVVYLSYRDIQSKFSKHKRQRFCHSILVCICFHDQWSITFQIPVRFPYANITGVANVWHFLRTRHLQNWKWYTLLEVACLAHNASSTDYVYDISVGVKIFPLFVRRTIERSSSHVQLYLDLKPNQYIIHELSWLKCFLGI